MQDSVKVFLEDDNEVLGNGQGDPYELQYLNTKEYNKILSSKNIKSTFYIDMGQYLFLKKNLKKNKKFASYIDSIEKTIQLLIKNKMDVQLHIHSQWHNAEYINDKFKVTDRWNIATLDNQSQLELFKHSYELLSESIKKFNGSEIINSYKAGSWGLQPFKNFHKILIDNNIKLLLGPAVDIKSEKMNIDFTNLKSKLLPYFPDTEDINKIGKKSNLFIFPISPSYLNWFDLIRYFLEKKIEKIFNRHSDNKEDYSKMKLNRKENFFIKGYRTHMKINSQKFWYLKKTFQRSYKNIIKNNYKYKVIVIETHTKDFKKNLDDINRFFEFIINNYQNIEFITSQDILNDFNKNIFIPLHVNEK